MHPGGLADQGAGRDIKLENALLDRNRRLLKITDFGYAKTAQDSLPKSEVGTPNYAAPEVISGSQMPYDGEPPATRLCSSRRVRAQPAGREHGREPGARPVWVCLSSASAQACCVRVLRGDTRGQLHGYVGLCMLPAPEIPALMAAQIMDNLTRSPGHHDTLPKHMLGAPSWRSALTRRVQARRLTCGAVASCCTSCCSMCARFLLAATHASTQAIDHHGPLLNQQTWLQHVCRLRLPHHFRVGHPGPPLSQQGQVQQSPAAGSSSLRWPHEAHAACTGS